LKDNIQFNCQFEKKVVDLIPILVLVLTIFNQGDYLTS